MESEGERGRKRWDGRDRRFEERMIKVENSIVRVQRVQEINGNGSSVIDGKISHQVSQ
jgi:hypothetical protein